MLIWVGYTHGVGSGISILNLLSVMCFVCHLKMSIKKNVDLHSPLFMDALSIAEVDVLQILGIHFDHKLTWSYMIDQLATRSCQ